jgi:hypothetical protein
MTIRHCCFTIPLKLKPVIIQKQRIISDVILNACSSAEASGQDAISSVKFFFPITILTYNLSLQQTGSVVSSHPKCSTMTYDIIQRLCIQ